jgi:hypothetical protein
MLFLGIIFGVIIGFGLKGKITHLADLKLHGISLVLISLAVQLAILASPLSTWPWFIQNGNLVYVISMVVLMLGLLYDRQYGWSFWLIIIGVASNIIVIAQNQGAIPVDLEKLSIVTGESVSSLRAQFAAGNQLSYRVPLTSQSELGWMGDVIHIPLPLLDTNIYSIGDVLISLGLAAFTVKAMLGHFKPKERKDKDDLAAPVTAANP